MDKRYQVFVSSTYEDLQEERKVVMEILLKLDCIPAGMELFPASSESQWSLIKRVIDDSDYYIVIIGGRYGSTNDKGISYTEMEYRYALEKGKPIISFLHKDPEEIKSRFTEKTQTGKKKLEEFRALVQQKVVRFWTNPNELGSEVSTSLVNLQKTNPSVGWVRADSVDNADDTQEILQLKKENEELKKHAGGLEKADVLLTEFGLLKVPSLKQAKEFGICAIAKGIAIPDLLKKKIEQARHVKVFQTTGRGFFQFHVHQLAKMLRNNGTLQVLLPNPYSDFLEEVGRIERRGKDNPISEEFHSTIDNIKKIWEEAHSFPCDTIGKIEIGCAHTMLRQTEIICIDKEDENDSNDKQIWCWVTMTMPPFRAGADSVSLECQTTRSGDMSLADMTNRNFNRSWAESQFKVEFDGKQDIPYFYKDYKDKLRAPAFWEEKLEAAKEFTRKARSDSQRSGILIEVAAQHPLEPNGTPGVEFSKRLDMGYELYRRNKAENIRCKIYVPGSLHMYNDVVDKVSLSESGRKYLIEKGVPSEDIYGEDQNVKYRGMDGVYNSADECFVASQIWKNEGFSELICVCSPVQSMRKTAHYIAFGVFPSVLTCPSPELFHDYVYEMFTALPYVLYEDSDLDPKKSKLAREHRVNRKPGFANAQDNAE